MGSEPPQPPDDPSARSIVHEINNQLSLAIYSAQLAASRLEPDSELRSHLERIESSARAVAGLVDQLSSTGAARGDETAGTPAASEREGGTVLTVDDSATVRLMIASALEAAGFRVISARDGPEALELLREHPEIEILLVDVQMPGMSGPQLATQAQRARPGLPILFVTGDAEGSLEFDGGTAPVVRKPFTESELLRGVRAALKN